jgi:hemoglobin
MEATDQNSLYKRLGETKGITAIVDDIIEAHMTNPGIKARFLPVKDDLQHFEVVRQHLINFIIMGCGGPQNYTGKNMTEAHRGMNINEKEYMNAIDDIMKTLEKHQVDEQSKKDVLAIVYSLKDTMIGV